MEKINTFPKFSALTKSPNKYEAIILAVAHEVFFKNDIGLNLKGILIYEILLCFIQ